MARAGRPSSWWTIPAAGIVRLRNSAPEQTYEENDQTDPTGRWRWLLNGDVLKLQRATAAEWATLEDWMSFDKSAEQINFGKTVNITTTVEFDDDEFLQFGSSQDVQMGWETADADANAFLVQLPAGGAVDVPVIIIGQSIVGVDLGLYNGVTEPRIALFAIGATTTGSVLEFRKSAGTITAPTAIASGVDLGFINAWACVAAGEWVKSAAIEFDSEGTIATTRGPGIIKLRTATDAAPSVLTTRLTIDSAGLVTLAGTSGIKFSPGSDVNADLITVNVTGTPTLIWEEANDRFVFNKAIRGDSYGQFGAYVQLAGNLVFNGNALYIQPPDTDANYFTIVARDSGVGLVEVARFAGAANPYVQIGRDDTGVALDAVTDMLVWQAGGGAGNEAANFGFGLSIKLGNAASEVEERASWDTVLVTATNGSEDSRYDWSLMAAGAMNLAMSLTGVGVLSVDLSGSGGAAQVDLFDEYDDALVLRQSIQQNNRQLLVDMGIAYEKPDGKGHMVKVQPMMRLLAGGIYQTRQMLEDLRDEVLERLERLEGARA